MVITGGTSGIGRATARELAVAGAEVVVTGRDARRTGAVADELTRSTGGHVTAEGADMGDLDAVRSLAARLVATHDRIDVLIHRARARSRPIGARRRRGSSRPSRRRCTGRSC